jgi:hypothetical protein
LARVCRSFSIRGGSKRALCSCSRDPFEVGAQKQWTAHPSGRDGQVNRGLQDVARGVPGCRCDRVFPDREGSKAHEDPCRGGETIPFYRVGCENSDSGPDQRFRGPAIWLRPGPDTCFVNIVWRHRPPCLTSGSREGSITHHGNGPRVPDQRNGARGEPLVRATIGISAPFTTPAPTRHLSTQQLRAQFDRLQTSSTSPSSRQRF